MDAMHAIGNANNVLIIFDQPRCANHGTWDHLRIFAPPPGNTERTPLPTANPGPIGNVIAFTDGSCLDNRYAKARARSSIWFGHNDPAT